MNINDEVKEIKAIVWAILGLMLIGMLCFLEISDHQLHELLAQVKREIVIPSGIMGIVSLLVGAVMGRRGELGGLLYFSLLSVLFILIAVL